jgi:hypothetical protein
MRHTSRAGTCYSLIEIMTRNNGDISTSGSNVVLEMEASRGRPSYRPYSRQDRSVRDPARRLRGELHRGP